MSAAPAADRTDWLTDWRVPLALGAAVVVGRLISLVVALLALSAHPEWEADTVVGVLCRWDCQWYVRLAAEGYDPVARHWARGDGANWAFFPLLPLLMAGLSAISGLSLAVSGLIVANLAFAGAVSAFFVYARDLAGPRFAVFAGLLLAFWPMSIHATVPMSEAVYLPLSILVFLFARREWWIAAGVTAALLSASRAVGVFGVLPILLVALQRYGLVDLIRLRPGAARASLACALSGFGLGITMLVQWRVTGDALAFSHVQTAWSREFLWPWRMMLDELSPWRVGGEAVLRNGARLLTGVAAALLTLVLIRRRLWPEAAFVAATMALAFTAGASMSLPRFSGALFPLVLAVAFLADRPSVRPFALVVSAGLLGVMTWLWVAIYAYAM